ncbi:MAG TPA: chemotaxis protein CheA [Cyanobacteria bacterium UBA12227]|nr:chemotaxis protein CheA [Cyanobacteria bacterium UBA12227]HAX89535.1 chemotaxis protein CheA [Cyanobacteria bacterium UBA11370]HBY79129.1 chemotaxis protein CheA [Cyanobacteria bacterium UBA11148]
MEIDEDVKEFLIEGYEHLNQIESDLVAIEQSNSDPEVMNRIYRNLHTIKGNSGFLGLERLQIVTHAGENLLSRLRDRLIPINPDVTSVLLQVVDAVRKHLETLEATGDESETDHNALLIQLNQLQEGEREREGDDTDQNKTEINNNSSFPSPLPTPSSPDSDSQQFKVADSAIRVDVSLLDKLMNLVGELVLCRNQIMEFANQDIINEQKDNTFKSASGRLNLVTSELQEGVMKTRMQPIRTIWNKFPRVVRDIAISLGKQVELEMEGEETELDKTLIEAIANPLTHIVRNCLDHGLETPNIRLAAGKSAVGRLLLRAYHESGHVIIEVSDDGMGINPERVKQKAVQRGMITPDQATQMNDQEALNLIFLPSFSTAETITNISGRGVGMDVVRTNIEKISGTVDVSSRVGQGTTFKLKIPLTLAIIPTLIITSGGDRYAIPQVNLLELVRLEGEQAKQSIEMFHGTPVYRLRGRLLPLVYLNHELKLDSRNQRNEQQEIREFCSPSLAHFSTLDNGGQTTKNGQLTTENDSLNIIVLQATDKPFGLVVDAINDTQEIVVKPLGKQLKSLACFAGATIMGDGKVALILDVQGLAQRTLLGTDTKEKTLPSEENRRREPSEEPQQLLLFQGPDHRRMAIFLSHVSRLEEFPCELIEHLGKQDVIQYRNQIMPLIYLSAVFGIDYNSPTSLIDNLEDIDEQSAEDENKIPLVVVSINEEQQVGLVVEQILDIVEQVITIKGTPTQDGILCCAVIQGQVTEIIDVEAVIYNNFAGARRQLVGVK